ncbi:MAG: DUF58 domain-containing protein [Gammaproteobacteria bacterium]
MTAPSTATEEHAFVFDSEFLRKLEQLELLAKKIFRGLLRGEHTTSRRGRGLEFSDFRRYRPGDDFRYIDWNIYSRLDRLVLKLYASEEDVTLHVLMDTSASMRFGDPLKFDYARRLAAALAYIGLNNLDRVSLTTFAHELGASLPPLKARHRMAAVLEFLAGLECGAPTRFRSSLKAFASRTRRPGLVILVSDLLSADESQEGETRAGLDALRHRGHDVIVLHLLSEEEIEPPLDGALRLVDSEDGTELKVTVDSQLREVYRRRLRAHLDELERYCLKAGIEYLRASTAIPFEDVLLRYLRQGSLLR